jgi:hypothetical protein
MASTEARLAWYAAALDELPSFLLSDEMLWPLQNPPAQVRQDLSLGGLLLMQDDLRGEVSLPAAGRRRLDELDERWASLRESHAGALARKARRERRMRVRLWKAYLTDLGETPGLVEEYPHQVRQRVMFERLEELGTAADEPRLDDPLRDRFRAGPFVWDEALKGAYPRERYWFLYGRPEA